MAKDPVFESPIEERLYNALAPEILPSLTIETQVKILNYRVDMRIRGRTTVVIECDGREYHNFNKDKERDYDLAERGGVDDIFRFKGTDIFFETADCVRQMKRMLPHLFTECEPLSLEDRALIGLSWEHMALQPIYRGNSPHGLFQIKSAYWSDKPNPERIWRLGDLVAMHPIFKERAAVP